MTHEHSTRVDSDDSPRAALRKKFSARMKKDRQTYTAEQIAEIERVYQVADQKPRSEEARDGLKKLAEKYGKANRAGCGLLYLARWSEGKEREGRLRAAIANHSDCMYGDGVEVGAYARYYLAKYYQGTGKTEEAQRLYQEIRDNYPNAVTHGGEPLKDHIPD